MDFFSSELKSLCVTPETPRTKLGRMTTARWKTLLGQLVDVEAIEEGKVDVSKVFTNRFLDEP